jgi:hypothetical protein
MFSGVPKWFLQNYGPTEAYRCALFRFYAVADLEKSDDEINQKMLKAHEKLLLSLTYRKDKKEQERLVKTLERKLMEDMGEALGENRHKGQQTIQR